MCRGLLIMITQRLRKELLKIIFLKKTKTKKTCVRILIKFSRKAGLFLCFWVYFLAKVFTNDWDYGSSLGTIPSSFAGLPISKGQALRLQGGIIVPTERRISSYQ